MNNAIFIITQLYYSMDVKPNTKLNLHINWMHWLLCIRDVPSLLLGSKLGMGKFVPCSLGMWKHTPRQWQSLKLLEKTELNFRHKACILNIIVSNNTPYFFLFRPSNKGAHNRTYSPAFRQPKFYLLQQPSAARV